MKNYFLGIISLLVLPALFSACTRYYKVLTQESATAQLKLATIDSLNKQKKYFLMHTGSAVNAINNLSIDMTDSTIAGVLTNVPNEHSLYLQPHRHFIWGRQRTYKKSEAGILNEIHLYSVDPIRDSAFNIPARNIQKIETIEYDKKKTTTLNAIGIAVMVAAVVATIVALSDLSHWGN